MTRSTSVQSSTFLFLFLLLAQPAAAQTSHLVATEAQLRAALATAVAGDSIVFQSNITLTADLPSVSTSLTIDGAGFTLSGNDQFRGFLVAAFEPGTATPLSIAVTIQNMTIASTVAAGGAGGDGQYGGGGGAGLGGAIFIGSQANVTLANINLVGNTAQGGSGGAGLVGVTDTGGGGGMGGDGGEGGGDEGGGGGGVGTGATPGSPGIMIGAAPGGASGGTLGGAQGGGGASGGDGGGGGGVAGGAGDNSEGGAGGFGGGGGGGRGEPGGSGGFGGGGGGGGGDGGFGGGGGGEGAGGVGGGSGGTVNGSNPGGGGGAGFGGALFLAPDSSLTVTGGLTINGNTVQPGLGGGGGATDGAAAGAGLFLAGNGVLFVAPGAGQTQTIADTIADEDGALGTGGQWSLAKNGEGTLVLSGTNLYSGGTVVSAGTLSVSEEANLGLGGLTLQNTGTLALTSSAVFTRDIFVSDTPWISVGSGVSATWAGTIGDDGVGAVLGVTGGGMLTLTGVNDYAGGTRVTGNSTLRIAADSALGDDGGLSLGDAGTSGTLAVMTGSVFTTARATVLGGGGGIFDMQGTADVLWEGGISGAGQLFKTGTGTLTLSETNTYAGGTAVQQGVLRAGDLNVFGTGAMDVAAGATLDLAGFNQTVGSLSGAGVVTLGTGTLTAGGNNATTLFSGDISGAVGTGGIVKTGTGIWALTGTNTYSGGTLVSGGILLGHSLSLQGAIVNNASVVFDQGFDGAYAGTMSGTGTLFKNGIGALTLSGANTYAGGTGVQLGVLRAGAVNVFGAGPMDVAAGGTLDLAGFNQTLGSLSGAGAVTLGTGTLTAGGNNATTLFSGGISGAGGIVKTGTGTWFLTGTNTYSGGTLVSDGALVGHSLSLQGSIVNNAAVVFDQGFDGEYTGTMSGTGGLVKTGTGMLSLFGTHTYLGGTVVLGGILRGHSVSLQGAIGNDAVVMFDQAFDGAFTGTMSGTGALFKAGTGTLSLLAPHTYAGGTFVSGNGAVAIGFDAALGTGSVWLGDATSSGTLRVFDGSAFTSARAFTLGAGGGIFNTVGSSSVRLDGTLAGGSLFKIGTGTLTLAGPGTYAATNLLEGVLRAGGAQVFGAGPMTIAGGATLDLAGFAQSIGTIAGTGRIELGGATLTTGVDNASSVFGGIISGSGRLVKAGTGTLFLTGANEYTGGTRVEDGTLAGDSTSLQGDVENDGIVVFEQGSDGTFAGSMSGTGLLAKSGAGTLTLLGTLTHTGGTVVTGGGLRVGYSTLGGTILNDGAVTFFGDGDGAFTGMLAGAGSYFKTGGGTMTLRGAHPMSGLFTVSAGTLDFDGTLGGSLSVAPGATALATGLIFGSLSLGGTLSAGLPAVSPTPSLSLSAAAAGAGPSATIDEPRPPALTVVGSFFSTPGSVLSLPLSFTLAPSLLVGGGASLNGTHLDFAAEEIGDRRSASFLAITALNGLNLTETTASTRDPLVVPFLRLTPNSLIVTLLNMNLPLAGAVTHPNAVAAGAAVDIFKMTAAGEGLDVVRELTALDDESLNEALRQIAGEIHASTVQLAVLDSLAFTDMLRDQLMDRTRESSGLRGWGGQRVRWWGQITGQRTNFQGDDVAVGGFANLGGGAGGFDWKVSERFLVGAGGGFGAGHLSLNQMAGSSDFQAPRVFGYGGFKHGRFGLRGGGSAARSRSTTDRRVAFAATMPDEMGGDLLIGGFDRMGDSRELALLSDEWSEYNDNFEYKTYTIDSNIGIRRMQFSRQGLLESGLGALALRLPDQTLAFKQVDWRLNVYRREGDYRPFFQSMYRRELTDGQIRTFANFSDVPGADFVVAGIPIPENLFAGRGGLTMETFLGEMTFQYRFSIAPGQRQHSGDFRLRW